MPAAYYNEIDPYAAQWLRNLIAAGHIAPGDVDERSIEDVRPSDLRGYNQCHFFAGIGVWSRALRDAGMPDGANVWTGSCPCQPFSAAGKGNGFADERHLWPAFHYLIEEHRPAIVFGEQVASAHVNTWIDLVQTDLEALDFAFGAVAFPAAGVGAPHIRDRTYWLAYANDARSQGRPGMSERADQCATRPGGLASGMADSEINGYEWRGQFDEPAGRPGTTHSSAVGALANAECGQFQEEGWRSVGRIGQSGTVQASDESGPTNGFWRTADWIACRDDKWRPVEPGTFPLANGAPARVGRLRAYGNAIVLPQATEFIRASLEAINVTFR